MQGEDWEIRADAERGDRVVAFGQEFPLAHPASIWAKLFRESAPGEFQYTALKKFHDYLFPDRVWHTWLEDQFREFCTEKTIQVWAAGSGVGKSFSAAALGWCFFLADPDNTGVIVASTTLASSEARVWGYMCQFAKDLALPYPIKYQKSKPPRFLFANPRRAETVAGVSGRQGTENMDDAVHCIQAVAAKKGDDQTAINTWIGRHPRKAMMVILDECPDMPVALVGAFPNLQAQLERFKVLGLGNSASHHDLHGILATPKDGWESVNPSMSKWETTQKDGVCLYFNPWENPAIRETDPVKRRRLLKIFPSEQQLEERKAHYGEKSTAYWRFVMGFWVPDGGASETLFTDPLMKVFEVERLAEWGGVHPLRMLAGLDPAFSSGGDTPVLRLGILGYDVAGRMTLDFRGDSLLFRLKIDPRLRDALGKAVPAEMQLAQQTIRILNQYRIPLSDLAIDSTGQGRALSEVIRLEAKSLHQPIKIYATPNTNAKLKKAFDVVTKSAYDLWMAMREYIQHRQIKGLDNITLAQLTTRLVKTKNGKPILESKTEYRARMMATHAKWGSPDEADAAALCLQVAILKYGFVQGAVIPREKVDYWVERVQMTREAIAVQEGAQGVTRPPVATFRGSLESAGSLKRKLF